MAKQYSFADLNKEMSKISQYGETLDKSTISEIDHFIPTGNYHLNACLTGSLFGGYPNNRAVALAGPSGTGKTYLALNAIKPPQQTSKTDPKRPHRANETPRPAQEGPT